MITKDMLEQRLFELKNKQEQLIADLNVVTGALKDCEYWLSVFDKPEQTE